MMEYLGADTSQPLQWPVRAAVLGAWSIAHGFAHLALEGRFDALAGARGLDQFVSDVLPDVLRNFRPVPDRHARPKRARTVKRR
jgi:hypothetical protein